MVKMIGGQFRFVERERGRGEALIEKQIKLGPLLNASPEIRKVIPISSILFLEGKWFVAYY